MVFQKPHSQYIPKPEREAKATFQNVCMAVQSPWLYDYYYYYYDIAIIAWQSKGITRELAKNATAIHRPTPGRSESAC